MTKIWLGHQPLLHQASARIIVSTDGQSWQVYKTFPRRLKDHEIDREMESCPWRFHFYQER